MCTMTFFPEIGEMQRGDSRWIFFNRDEQRTRGRAEPPKQFSGRNGSYLMPVDPDSGGSWMGVHSSGFFIGLVNNYPGDKIIRNPSMRSRGLLIRDLLDAGKIPDNQELERMLEEQKYAPFYLAALTSTITRAWEWDLQKLRTLDIPPSRPGMISSSGVEHRRISTRREEMFHKFLAEEEAESPPWNPGRFAGFHRRKSDELPGEAPCMSRSDAHTVSISEISLSSGELRLHYYPDPPFTDPLNYRVSVQASSGQQN